MRTLEQEEALRRWEKYHADAIRRSNRFLLGWVVTSVVLASVITYMVMR